MFLSCVNLPGCNRRRRQCRQCCLRTTMLMSLLMPCFPPPCATWSVTFSSATWFCRVPPRPPTMTTRRRWRRTRKETSLSCPASRKPPRFSSSYGIKASPSVPRASSTMLTNLSLSRVQFHGPCILGNAPNHGARACRSLASSNNTGWTISPSTASVS